MHGHQLLQVLGHQFCNQDFHSKLSEYLTYTGQRTVVMPTIFVPHSHFCDFFSFFSISPTIPQTLTIAVTLILEYLGGGGSKGPLGCRRGDEYVWIFRGGTWGQAVCPAQVPDVVSYHRVWMCYWTHRQMETNVCGGGGACLGMCVCVCEQLKRSVKINIWIILMFRILQMPRMLSQGKHGNNYWLLLDCNRKRQNILPIYLTIIIMITVN